MPQGVIVHTSSPALELLHALYFYLAWTEPDTITVAGRQVGPLP